jgi:hypothetical protein
VWCVNMNTNYSNSLQDIFICTKISLYWLLLVYNRTIYSSYHHQDLLSWLRFFIASLSPSCMYHKSTLKQSIAILSLHFFCPIFLKIISTSALHLHTRTNHIRKHIHSYAHAHIYTHTCVCTYSYMQACKC